MSTVINVRAEILELPEINTIPGTSQFYVLSSEGPSARVSFDSLTAQIKSAVEDVAVRLKLDFATLQGLDGADGEGVPAGGGAGQVLSKIDGVDFNTEWIDLPESSGPSLPVGGLTGQILAKSSDNDGEAVWVDPPQDGANGADGEGVPQGGDTGQFLSKIDGVDFNAQWVDITAHFDPSADWRLPQSGSWGFAPGTDASAGTLSQIRCTETGEVQFLGPTASLRPIRANSMYTASAQYESGRIWSPASWQVISAPGGVTCGVFLSVWNPTLSAYGMVLEPRSYLVINDLPSVAPSIPNAVWNDSGTLKIT